MNCKNCEDVVLRPKISLRTLFFNPVYLCRKCGKEYSHNRPYVFLAIYYSLIALMVLIPFYVKTKLYLALSLVFIVALIIIVLPKIFSVTER